MRDILYMASNQVCAEWENWFDSHHAATWRRLGGSPGHVGATDIESSTEYVVVSTR